MATYLFLEVLFPIYFPGKKSPELDYGALVSVMQQTIDAHGLQPHPWFMGKVMELYEMIVVRCAAASVSLIGSSRSDEVGGGFFEVNFLSG